MVVSGIITITCKYATLPKTRQDYWLKKIDRNVDNDLKHYKELEQLDYKVIVVWECEIKECFEYRMRELVNEILEEINAN